MKIIITGASSGLGRMLGEKFATRGDQVGLMARSEALLQEINRNLYTANRQHNVFWRACDLRDNTKVEDVLPTLIEEMGGVDVLINNANVTIKKGLLEISTTEWRESVGVGLEAAFNCIRIVVPHFIKHGGGHIINIGSLSTKIPLERGCSYSASKHAMNGFSKSLVHELHLKGIKVCTIHPGAFLVEQDADSWKMPASEVFRACEYILSTDPKAFVEELIVRPLKWPE
jgi:short-subunit dehydrogenase